jgi:hypothetical protein
MTSMTAGSNEGENASPAPAQVSKLRDVLILLLLTVGALLVHGYHPGAEDAEIYLPAIVKTLRLKLLPLN